MSKRAAVLAATLLALTPAAVLAQTTPESAQALEQQVREWITTTLGPSAKIAKRPIQLTADGDHYRVAVPFGEAPDSPLVTATARMTGGGRWAIDDIRLPSPSEFHVNLPRVSKDGAGKDGAAGGMSGPITYKLNVGQQAGQILLDPTFATSSTSNSTVQNLDLQASGEHLQQTSHLDRGSSTTILRPAASGRVDLLMDTTLEGYRINSETQGSEPLKLGMGRVRANAEVNGVSRDRTVQIVQALVQIGSAMQASERSGNANAAPKLDPNAAQTLLEALADFASGMSFDESMENLSMTYGGMSGTLRAARIGFSTKADAGLLQARLDLGAEGLAIPDLPLGAMADLIPSKITIRPAVSGVAAADLIKLAKASENGGSPTPADIQALFSHGGITAGIESFAIDVAGAGFTGMGKFLFTSPQDYSGTAQLTATNLDLLQQRIASDPDLAQGLPVIIFLKGIGRTVNNGMVWDVAYSNGRLLVNNQDLTAMMAGGQGDQGGPKSPPRGQQQRPSRNRP